MNSNVNNLIKSSDGFYSKKEWGKAEASYKLIFDNLHSQEVPLKIYVKRSIVLRMMGFYERSYEIIMLGMNVYGSSINLKIELAALYNRKKLWEDACSVWMEVHHLSSLSVLNYQRYSIALFNNGLKRNALKILKEGLGIYFGNKVLLNELRSRGKEIFVDDFLLNSPISQDEKNKIFETVFKSYHAEDRKKLYVFIEDILLSNNGSWVAKNLLKKFATEISCADYLLLACLCCLYVDYDQAVICINEEIEKRVSAYDKEWLLDAWTFFRACEDRVFANSKLAIFRHISKEFKISLEKKISSLIINDDFSLQKIHGDIKKTNKTGLNVCVVAACLPATKKSSMLHTTYSLIETLQLSKKCRVFFALTGEHSIETAWGGCETAKRKELHNALFNKIKSESTESLGDIYNGLCPENGAKRYNNILEWLVRNEIDALIFIGDAFESKFFRFSLFKNFPILYAPMGISNNPSGFVDVVASTKNEYKNRLIGLGNSYNFFDTKSIFRKFENDHDFQGCLGEDGFKVVTALQGGRLNKLFKTLSADYCEVLNSFFTKNRLAKWVVIGPCDLDKVFEKHSWLLKLYNEDRFISLSYVNELRGVLRKCDLFFIMPSMEGGNQTALNAMDQGIPIVVNNYCDSVSIAPSSCVFSSPHELSSILQKLVQSNSFYENMSIEAVNASNSRNPQNVSDLWYKAVEETINLYDIRNN